MNEGETSFKRWPLLALCALAVTAAGMFGTLKLGIALLGVAVALSVGSFVLKERPRWISMSPVLLIGMLLILRVILNGVPSTVPVANYYPPQAEPMDMSLDRKWQYTVEKDEMRGMTTKMATLESMSVLELPEPYDGPNIARIMVVYGGRLILSVDKGQLTCGPDNTVAMKLDDGPVWDFDCEPSTDGSADHIFIVRGQPKEPGQPVEPKLLLGQGKTLTIEASFYGAGSRQLKFNVAGYDETRLYPDKAQATK